MIRIQEEKPDWNLYVELMPLLKGNWITSGSDRSLPLDLDVERFLALSRSGNLVLFTARDEDQLVGFAVASISWSWYVKSILTAHGVGFYLITGYKGHAPKLLEAIEACLKARGVRYVGWFLVPNSRGFCFFTEAGYAPDEVCLEKNLCA